MIKINGAHTAPGMVYRAKKDVGISSVPGSNIGTAQEVSKEVSRHRHTDPKDSVGGSRDRAG